MVFCRFAINFLSVSIEFDFFHDDKLDVRVENCSISSNEWLGEIIVGIVRIPVVILIEMNKIIISRI